MTGQKGELAVAHATALTSLLAVQPQAVASRVLLRSPGGNVTLFAIDAGEGLSEHSTPFEALIIVLEGRLGITVGGTDVVAGAEDIVRLPAAVPHAVEAREPSRMLLVMLK